MDDAGFYEGLFLWGCGSLAHITQEFVHLLAGAAVGSWGENELAVKDLAQGGRGYPHGIIAPEQLTAMSEVGIVI